MRTNQGVSARVLDRLRTVCSALLEVTEEQAWVGTRWCIRKHNFAHAVSIEADWPQRTLAPRGPMARRSC